MKEIKRTSGYAQGTSTPLVSEEEKWRFQHTTPTMLPKLKKRKKRKGTSLESRLSGQPMNFRIKYVRVLNQGSKKVVF